MPRWFLQLRLRLRSLFRETRADQELDEELQYHLERQIEERLAAGLTPEQARWAARRDMGATAQNREVCRDARGVGFLQHAIRDLRFTVRQLLKNPGFTGTAVFVLALGLCASATIFGFVEATLIKPFPYRDQSRLVTVSTASPGGEGGLVVSYIDYLDWRQRNRVFSSIDAYDVRYGYTLTTAIGSQPVTGLKVTAGFFRTLGVTPALGRDFRPDEELRSAAPTVMLTHSAWQARFAGRTNVLGEVVTLDGLPHTIIGVLPAEFHFPPAGTMEFVAPMRSTNPCWQIRGCQSLVSVARLKDGVSIQTAIAEMKAVARQLETEYPDSNRDKSASARFLRDALLGDVRPMLLMLFSGAALLLLIACINVASLLMARADSRTREIAVRKALGASFMRLVLQFAVEALALVAAAAALGLIGAHWGMRLLRSLIAPDMLKNMPYLEGLGVNAGVVAFTGTVAIVAAMLFTITPILRASRPGALEGLNEGSRGSAGRTWRRFGAHFVVVELAIAVILLVNAGLLARSLQRMFQVDIGFSTDRLTTMYIGLPPGDFKPEQTAAIAQRVVERVATLPGVESAGVTDLPPLSAGGSWPPLTAGFKVVGRPNQDEPYQAVVRAVSPGYFATIQARQLRGRSFTNDDDASKPRVVIINRTMAEQLFRGEDPIGKQMIRTNPPAMQIVGIVADIQEGSLETPARPAVYAPFAQRPNLFTLAVRTSRPDQQLVSSVTAVAHQIHPDTFVGRETTMSERIARLPAAFLNRSSAWLVGSFATIALIMSVVGLYGVVSYSVGQRTREMGVRIALGAQSRAVYRLVLGEAGWLIGVGTTVGIVCAVAAATLIRRLLFGVQAWDVPTLAAVAFTLVVAALLASYLPARRAASVNPIEVLRAE